MFLVYRNLQILYFASLYIIKYCMFLQFYRNINSIFCQFIYNQIFYVLFSVYSNSKFSTLLVYIYSYILLLRLNTHISCQFAHSYTIHVVSLYILLNCIFCIVYITDILVLNILPVYIHSYIASFTCILFLPVYITHIYFC